MVMGIELFAERNVYVARGKPFEKGFPLEPLSKTFITADSDKVLWHLIEKER